MPKPPETLDFPRMPGVRRIMAFADANAVRLVGEAMSRFALSQGELQSILGTSAKLTSREAQVRLEEMLDIIGLVRGWTKTDHEALAWYRGEPIAAFGGEASAELVNRGMSSTVRDYIEQISLGGHA